MLDGITLEKAAEEFDISPVRAYQIVRHAWMQLRKHIK